MFKKMDILKNINELIKGYHNNKLGIIYLLYYFPPIVINKFSLSIKDIDEDVYISKLSSYFTTYKWITINRKIINKKEENNFINNNFIITNNKLEIKKDEIEIETFYYYDINSNKKELSNNSIKYIDNKNSIIYCIFDDNIQELVILSKIFQKNYKIKKNN